MDIDFIALLAVSVFIALVLFCVVGLLAETIFWLFVTRKQPKPMATKLKQKLYTT